MCEAQEVERFRLTKSPSDSISGRKATELDQTSLLRVQRQHELFQPRAQIRQKTLSVLLVLKASYDIVSEAHVQNLPAGVTMSPSLGP